MKKLQYALYVIIVLAFTSCKKPYNPSVVSTSGSYLVVEGVINSGADSTIIKLSKTVSLNAKTSINPVIGAVVTVESNQNNTFSLSDLGNGTYGAPSLHLVATQQYRLRIKTNNGNEYLSDFVAVKSTPPIDSIGYTFQGNSLNLYVNTHDAANATRYYRWDFDEDWEFHSKYRSEFVLDNVTNSIVPRNSNQQIYYCYQHDASSSIILASTTNLKNDVVYQNSLVHIPLNSEKIELKYSILLRQYALSQAAFEFYQNLKKNTEELGSIFDAQPSLLSGNLHCINNPNEPVIGYITATNIQYKRVFITYEQLATGVQPTYPYDCEQDTALYVNKQGYNDVQNTLINPPLTAIPTTAIHSMSGGILGYLYSTPICVDCTLRGTAKAPSFWK